MLKSLYVKGFDNMYAQRKNTLRRKLKKSILIQIVFFVILLFVISFSIIFSIDVTPAIVLCGLMLVFMYFLTIYYLYRITDYM